MKKKIHKNSVKINYAYNMGYQLLILIMPLITTPYVSRILGADGIGISGYTISIVTYFVLFGSLGISIYGQREIAYFQENKKERSKIFFELIALKLISMTISMILFYLFFAKSGHYSAYYKILLLEMVANVFDIVWFYQGMERFKKTTLRNGFIKALSVVAIFMFVKKESDITNYLYIYCLTTLFSNLSLWFRVNKYIEIPESLNILRHLKNTIYLFIPQVAVQVYTVLDKTMIGGILGDMSQVGYYEQVQKIIKVSLVIVTSMGTAMLPRIANCYATNDKKKIKEYIGKAFSFSFLFSIPMAFGMIAIASKFVPSFFGPDFYPGIPLMQIMSVITIFISLSNVIGIQYLLPTKKEKYYTISVIVGALVNLVLNYFLIKCYKSLGATIATVIAELIVTAIQFYFVRKEFKFTEIIKLSKNYFIASIVMFIIVSLINQTDIFIRSITIIIETGVGTIIYILMLYILKDPFFLSTYKSLKKMIFKK